MISGHYFTVAVMRDYGLMYFMMLLSIYHGLIFSDAEFLRTETHWARNLYNKSNAYTSHNIYELMLVGIHANFTLASIFHNRTGSHAHI